jgi:hypothetical protein
MEYEFGIGGRKAARRFTPRERGACKYKVHRRRGVWDKIIELICSGHTAQTALDTIYDVYWNDKAVTAIINAMRCELNREYCKVAIGFEYICTTNACLDIYKYY